MVHELIGVRNNRVDMSRCPGITKELQVLAVAHSVDGRSIEKYTVGRYVGVTFLDVLVRGFIIRAVFK